MDFTYDYLHLVKYLILGRFCQLPDHSAHKSIETWADSWTQCNINEERKIIEKGNTCFQCLKQAEEEI